MIFSSDDPGEVRRMADACGIGGEAVHSLLEGVTVEDFLAQCWAEDGEPVSDEEKRRALGVMANLLIEVANMLDEVAATHAGFKRIKGRLQ